MIKISLKVWKIIKYRVKDLFHQIRVKQIRKDSIRLRKKNQTDYKRWKNSHELLQDWDDRTVILAGMIKSGSKVIEFGAGNMSLQRMLPLNCSYTPSDIYRRRPEYLVCDLNQEIEFKIEAYDTAVLSGVLEYVYDVDKVFQQLNPAIENIVLSYAFVDISNADRLNSGWLSDFSRKELEEIFFKYKYKIVEYKEWRKQSLYKLVKE